MYRSVSISWKTFAVLTMIFVQIVAGSLCSTPSADRSVIPSGVAVVMPERGSPAENRALIVSDSDHHLRCEQRCPQGEIDDLRFSEAMRYSVSADVLRKSPTYLISRPPKRMS